MTDLRITDAPELTTIEGAEKIPTGNSGGNFAISLDSLTQYVKYSKDLQSGAEVEATVAPVEMEIATHVADLENPHQVTKEQVGLGNVDNTADTDKPISSAVAAAITTLTTNKADKTYVDSQLALKANQLTTYTKTDVDNLLATKANQSTTYTKTEVNTFLTNKQERLSVDGTLTGSRSFDTVPKLDGLDGNPSPIMNQQAQALMNRTESLNYDISTMLNYYDSSFSVSVGGYPLNSRVVLSDGTLVRSNTSNNINDPNTNMTGWELALPHVNTEGTYTKVTTDKYGRVVSGENPNTLAGIGITNAYTKTEVDSVISSSVPVVVDATTVDKGIVELATQAEVNTGTDNERAVTPATLKGGIQSHLNVTGNAPMYACRAWANWDGVNNILNASGNISSVTDNGVGDFTFNFTTAMPDINYAVSAIIKRPTNNTFVCEAGTRTTTACQLKTKQDDSGAADGEISMILVR